MIPLKSNFREGRYATSTSVEGGDDEDRIWFDKLSLMDIPLNTIVDSDAGMVTETELLRSAGLLEEVFSGGGGSDRVTGGCPQTKHKPIYLNILDSIVPGHSLFTGPLGDVVGKDVVEIVVVLEAQPPPQTKSIKNQIEPSCMNHMAA